MATVFLSSTLDDLREYRAAAFDILRRIGHEPIGIETLHAADLDPLLATLQQVAKADLVIVIVARRYGRIPPNQRHSMVEAEYEHAMSGGKPVLVFLLADSASWPAEPAEPDQPLVGQFRARLMQARLVSFFESLPDFAGKLESAVRAWTARTSGIRVTLEDLPLAWRLVNGSFAEPELLQHLDPAAFVAAIEKWEEANGADRNAPWPSRLARARLALDSSQTDHDASPLWLAWIRATRLTNAPGDTGPADGTAP